MEIKKCPYCHSGSIVKNGRANRVQRWKCLRCKHNFTDPKDRSTYRFYTSKQKQDAIIAYLENKKLASFARRRNISRELIYYWVKQFKKRIFYKKGVLAKVHMTNEEKRLYEHLFSRRGNKLRCLYTESVSLMNKLAQLQGTNRRWSYGQILNLLAKNFDLLPTEADSPGNDDQK